MPHNEPVNVEDYFSARSYARHYARYAVHQRGAWYHYMNQGEDNGYWPVDYFSPNWWKSTHSLGAGKFDTCFENYLNAHQDKAPSEEYAAIKAMCFPTEDEFQGAIETGGRSQNGLIDFGFLARQNKRGAAAPDPICLYLRLYGEGFAITPTPFFDPAFYLKEYRDVATAGVDPYVHFIKSGLFEGRRPAAYLKLKIDFSRYTDKEGALRSVYSPSELFELEHPYELDRGEVSSIAQVGRPYVPANHFFGEPRLSGLEDFEQMLPVYRAYFEAGR